MNANRFASIEESQSGTAKKVLQAVPIAEAWSLHQIATEVHRMHTTCPAFNILEGVIKSLKETGLVREVGRGTYQRMKIKEAEPVMKIVQSTPIAEPQISRLAAIAKQARGLSNVFKDMADDIELTMLEHEEELKAASSGNEKLKQLQALLKGLA